MTGSSTSWRGAHGALVFLVWLLIASPIFAWTEANAAPPVQAVPLYFLSGSPRCHGSFDFACLSPGDYLITINQEEQTTLLASKNYNWQLRSDQAFVFPTQAKGLLALFRYYNVKTNDHFFTTSSWEGGEAVKWLGYVLEGVCCYISPTQVAGTVPLYRYLDANLHDYQLTAPADADPGLEPEGVAGFVWTPVSPAPTLPAAATPPSTTPNVPKGKVAAVALFELRTRKGDNALITDNPDEAYELRNVTKLGWTGADPTFAVFPQPAVGTIPLFRYENPKTKDHFFTTDQAEGQNAVATLNYVAEGICCYLSPTQVKGTSPLFRLLKGNQHLFVAEVSTEESALGAGYKLEGIAGYLWPLPGPSQPLLLLPAD